MQFCVQVLKKLFWKLVAFSSASLCLALIPVVAELPKLIRLKCTNPFHKCNTVNTHFKRSNPSALLDKIPNNPHTRRSNPKLAQNSHEGESRDLQHSKIYYITEYIINLLQTEFKIRKCFCMIKDIIRVLDFSGKQMIVYRRNMMSR
jgi:hypothetical protein